MTAATCRHGSHPGAACRECARAFDRLNQSIGHDQPRDRTPAIGDRRPREGRCERCDRPLTDLVWTTWTPISLFGPEFSPVTDWREEDPTDDSRCVGEPLCDRAEIDWRARALAAEAQIADAEARGRAEGRLSGLFDAWCAADQSRAIARAVREGETTTHGRTHATGVIDGADMLMESIAALAQEATDGR